MTIAQQQIFDKYGVFDFVGASALDEQTKDSILVDLNAMIWQRFMSERLAVLLTAEQLVIFKKRLDSGEKMDSVVGELSVLVPNLGNLVAEYARIVKAEYIEKYLLGMVAAADEDRELTQDEKMKEELFEKREKYMKACELFRQNMFEEVIKHFGV